MAPKNRMVPPGDTWRIGSGGELEVKSGGSIDVESGGSFKIAGTAVAASADEINKLNGAPLDASFSIAAEAGNAIVVSIQLKDADGADLAVRGAVRGYLSDDANGDSIVATAPDGTVAAGTDGVVVQTVAKKFFEFISEADGDIDLSIGESGVKTCYLILILPNGKLKASGAITFA